MKSLCPECGHLHKATETCPEVFFKPEMTLDRAFEIIIGLARENQVEYLEDRALFREQGRALDLVTAYHLVRVKAATPAPVINSYVCPGCDTAWSDTWSCSCNDHCPGCGLGDVEPIRSE